MTRRSCRLAVLLALGIVVAACGGQASGIDAEDLMAAVPKPSELPKARSTLATRWAL